MEKITFRFGTLHDIVSLQELFVDTIKRICIQDYSAEQVAVWSSSSENMQRWTQVLTEQYVLIAALNNSIVGFCTLAEGRYIDLFFVHKDYQGQKIASQLYQYIEAEARRQNTDRLTADVSKTAKPFFIKMGFTTVKEQEVILKNVPLINYKMVKMIRPNQNSACFGL